MECAAALSQQWLTYSGINTTAHTTTTLQPVSQLASTAWLVRCCMNVACTSLYEAIILLSSVTEVHGRMYQSTNKSTVFVSLRGTFRLRVPTPSVNVPTITTENSC